MFHRGFCRAFGMVGFRSDDDDKPSPRSNQYFRLSAAAIRYLPMVAPGR